MMLRPLLLSLCGILVAFKAYALPADYAKYFKVDMAMEIPDIYEYAKTLRKRNPAYDKGYISRFRMGNTFNKSFSKIIKYYGLSESRLKARYEDDLLELIGMLPKEMYQYIGPMLHEVPGMSEKILNLPGIKETKNQFPQDVADRFKGMEGLEDLSPALYFVLMPSIWEQKPKTTPDMPEEKPAKKPRPRVELPDFLKEKIGLPVKTAEKAPASAARVATVEQKLGLRTLNPSLTSPLTSADVRDYVDTIDLIMDWAMQDNMRNYSKLIHGGALLDAWEAEHNTALSQNMLKDVVNPCQRLVLKTRFSGVYGEFAMLTAQKGFTPEGWAYTCDKTIKAFRILEATPSSAYAVRFHRNGYYNEYIKKLPKRWREEMYALEEAINRMHRVFKDDIETVRPYQEKLRQKFIKYDNVILNAPIIY